jgi:hypothetical protein
LANDEFGVTSCADSAHTAAQSVEIRAEHWSVHACSFLTLSACALFRCRGACEAHDAHTSPARSDGGDIGASLAVRDLIDVLRQSGKVIGGPAPMTPKDRSRFLCQLVRPI